MTARDAAPDAGFTLVEMLVALALFAMIGLAAFTTLDTVVRVRGQTEGRIERLGAIDRALTLLSRDLMQALPGDPARDADGATLRFRRSGEDGALRVAWGLRDGTLLRTIVAGDAPVVEQPVLADVDALTWRFLDTEPAWHEAWPPDGGEAGGATLRGIEATLTLDGGPLRRLVELPSAAGRS